MLEKLNELLEPEIKFKLDESSEFAKLVDGENILACVEGEFFVPDGKSRNGRFYPRSLWEKVINDPSVKRRLKKRTMFGTVGHDAELGDAAIREGVVSHFMVDIHINEKNKGMGKALILNTPVGRIVNTVLRAGCELAVSSRANGTFKGKKFGLPVVDGDTYDVDGWDFVIDPGFLEAQPKIAESLQEIKNSITIETSKEGEEQMEQKTVDQTLVEHISNENADLKSKVGDLTDENTALKEDKTTIEDENKNLKEELNKLEEAEKTIASYKELGTAEEIKEKLEAAKNESETLAKFVELADTPEEAKTALEEADNFICTVNTDLGGIESIKEDKEALSKFSEIGTFDQISEALTRFDDILTTQGAEKLAGEIKEVSKELGLSEEKVTELLKKYSVEDIRELCSVTKPANENDDSDNYKKKTGKIEENIEEDNKSTGSGKTLAEKIAESL